LRATWFNQPFMQKKFRQGQHLLLTAAPKMRGLMWEMSHPQVTYLADEEAPIDAKLLPVYALTEGLSQFHIRRIVQAAVEDFAGELEEVFPESLLKQYRLMPLVDAVRAIHQPADREELGRARRRFVFQELFVLQLGLSIRRSEQRSLKAYELPATARIDARIRRLLPFELTDSQNAAIKEIGEDMALDRPMNRLLQGDVGSGKTIVALYAMLTCVAHGRQAALMAPTEILARQHADTLAKMLEASRVKWARSPAAFRKPSERSDWSRSPPAKSTWSSARTPSCRRRSSSKSWAWWSSTSSTSSACASAPRCAKAASRRIIS
jgi:ATP-dependent DNA helicase RecG